MLIKFFCQIWHQNFLIFTLCLFLALVGCEQTFVVEMDVSHEERLHSIGYIVNGQDISLYVQLTQNPLSPQPDHKLDLDITLKNQLGEAVKLTSTSTNFYQTSEEFIPETGECFLLQVDYEPLGIVRNTKQVCVPAPVVIDSLSVSFDGQQNGLFYFYFTDPPGPNYYAIRLLKFDEEGNEIIGFEYKLLPETSFSDQVAVNGQITTFTRSSVVWRNDQGYNYVHAVKAILYHLDEHTFQFLQSLSEAEGSLDDLWSEPTMVYSNMSNKVGLFGAFATDTLHMDLNLQTKKISINDSTPKSPIPPGPLEGGARNSLNFKALTNLD